MENTRYTDTYAFHASLGGGLEHEHDTQARAWGAGSGEARPLVLIEEHLTDKCLPPLPEPAFRNPCVAGKTLTGWSIPVDGVGPKNEYGEHFVEKVQRFAAGGFEVTVRSVDLEKIAHHMQGIKKPGKREKPDELNMENVLAAAKRAKQKVRYLTKNMGATHLVTFTRRETEATGFATVDQWAKDWDKMRRLLVKAKGEFPYVGVLERHKKGNYHLHVAWAELPGQKVNLNLVRGCWWAVLGGRGQGNVDAQFIKVRAGLERADKVARYISKYTSKHFEDDCRFNKKRYWASRQDLPGASRKVIRASTTSQALEMVMQAHGLSMNDYMKMGQHGLKFDGFFPFPDGSGFWFSFVPGKNSTAPPPF